MKWQLSQRRAPFWFLDRYGEGLAYSDVQSNAPRLACWIVGRAEVLVPLQTVVNGEVRSTLDDGVGIKRACNERMVPDKINIGATRCVGP